MQPSEGRRARTRMMRVLPWPKKPHTRQRHEGHDDGFLTRHEQRVREADEAIAELRALGAGNGVRQLKDRHSA
jgi:hypothetical protein